MIALFIPCVVDQFFPEAGEATADLIESAGLEADYPADQTCCGLPFYNMGHWDAARPLARRFLDIFEGYEAVVTPQAPAPRWSNTSSPTSSRTIRRPAAARWPSRSARTN